MTGRRRIKPLYVLLLAVLALVIVPSIQVVNAANPANLSVVTSGTVLYASRNNTLTIEISNVGGYVKELDVALTIPPPLVLFGDNHWIRSSFSLGEVIRADLTIFAPSSAAGTTLQGSIIGVYKAAGETVRTSETHAISFLIRGWIDMQVYEVTVDPDPVLGGGVVTISGNLLNRGVIAAMYANVTLAADRPLVEGSIESTYVGEVDPNAPAPFSLTTVVDATTQPGRYQVTILVYYSDDLQIQHTITAPISLNVVSELPKAQTARTSLTDQLLSNLALPLGLAIVILLAIVGIYLRRRRKGQKIAENSQ